MANFAPQFKIIDKNNRMMETKTFAVNGMKCEHCKANVENAVRNLAGVSKAQVSLADKNITVSYDPAQVQPEQMKEAVDNLGRFEMEL